MRTLNLILIALLMTLSGCTTRWVVFGHSMGGAATDRSAQSTVTSPPAPVAQTTETAPSTVGTQLSPTTPAESAAKQTAAPPSAPTIRPAAASESWKIKAVKVTFTPAAKAQIATEPQFTEDGLFAAIQAELRAQRLLDESDPQAGNTIGIVIDDFAIRSESNAVIFGYVFSSGALEGTLEVHASDGHELRSSRIRARSRLTKPASAGPANSFEPLYRRFADLTAHNLTGTPEPVGVNH